MIRSALLAGCMTPAPWSQSEMAPSGASRQFEPEQDYLARAREAIEDMAHDACKPPANYDQDLVQMLKDLIAKGVSVKVCGTCMARCGIYKNQPYFDGAQKSTMPELAEWVVACDKVITF